MATLKTLKTYLQKLNIKESASESRKTCLSDRNSVSLKQGNVICPSCGCPDLSYNNSDKLYSCQNCFEHDLAYEDLLNDLKNPQAFKKLSLLYDANTYLSDLMFSNYDALTLRENQVFELLFDLLRRATEDEVNDAGVSRFIIKNNELSYRFK